MVGEIVTTFPADIQEVIQQGFLNRSFRDALMPRVLYRSQAERVEIPEMAGEGMTITRDGLVTPRVIPTAPGQPTPEITYSKEQWTIAPKRWTSKKTTRLPNSAMEARNRFLKDSAKLAEHAGLSIDRVARNSLFIAYLGGDTLSTASAASGQATMAVAALAGFRFTETATGVLSAVTNTNKLSVTVTSGAGTQVVNVQSSTPVNALYPDGPGILTFDANLGATHSARARVFAVNKPFQALPSGVSTIDGITGSSVVAYTQFLSAVRWLSDNNVPRFADGTYHMLLDAVHLEQFLNDSALRQYFQGVPDAAEVRMGIMSKMLGITFINSNDNPKPGSVSAGTQNLTGSALQAPEIGAEVQNNAGVVVRRSMLLGAGAIAEGYIPEERYKAQTQGREGAFGYDGGFFDGSGAYNAMLDGIRLHIRPPIDDHGDEITQAYSLTAAWVPPPDLTATTATALYKRAVVVSSFGPN